MGDESQNHKTINDLKTEPARDQACHQLVLHLAPTLQMQPKRVLLDLWVPQLQRLGSFLLVTLCR